MCRVKPFRGVRYAQSRIESMARVVAPPYDIITPEERERLYAQHPQNIVRVILGRDRAGDSDKEDKYTRAARFYRRWLAQGVLSKDDAPGLYVYDQEYEQDGRRIVRRGLLAIVRLEEFSSGRIHPHEQVFLGPQKGRMRLLRESHANFSPIFGLYDDAAGRVDPQVVPEEPLFAFSQPGGIEHRVGVIRSTERVTSICRALEDSHIFIADGHHRYLTALHLRKELEKEGLPVPPGVDYTLMYLSNMHSPSLTILPVHRLLGGCTSVQVDELIAQMSVFFYRRPFGPGQSVRSEEQVVEKLLATIDHSPPYTYGMFSRESGFLLLTPRDAQAFAGRLKSAILDELVLDLLGKQVLEKGREIDFTTNNREAVALVQEGRFRLVFFLPAVQVSEIRAVALRGGRMPPKSSYFHPKPFSGLVIRDLEDVV